MKKVVTLWCLIILASVSYSQKISDFRLKDTENNNRNFSDLKGKELTLIDFWATWCKPCIKSIPSINRLHKTFSEAGVSFISVNCDGPRSVAKAGPVSKTLKIEYPVLLDIDSDLRNQLNITGFPSVVLLDATGKVVWMHEGFQLADEELIAQAIKNQLKAK